MQNGVILKNYIFITKKFPASFHNHLLTLLSFNDNEIAEPTNCNKKNKIKNTHTNKNPLKNGINFHIRKTNWKDSSISNIFVKYMTKENINVSTIYHT